MVRTRLSRLYDVKSIPAQGPQLDALCATLLAHEVRHALRDLFNVLQHTQSAIVSVMLQLDVHARLLEAGKQVVISAVAAELNAIAENQARSGASGDAVLKPTSRGRLPQGAPLSELATA